MTLIYFYDIDTDLKENFQKAIISETITDTATLSDTVTQLEMH